MSEDPSDAIAQAVALQKKLAASHLVRKQEAEAELKRLEAAGAGPEQVEPVLTEIAHADAQMKAALAEIAELKKLASRGVAPAIVAAATSPDPVIKSVEDAALERAREHIGELDARAFVRVDAQHADLDLRVVA